MRALLLKTARAKGEPRRAVQGRADRARRALERSADVGAYQPQCATLTPLYMLRSLDFTLTPSGAIEHAAEDSVFRPLFSRTFESASG